MNDQLQALRVRDPERTQVRSGTIRGGLMLLLAVAALSWESPGALAQENAPEARLITLDACIRTALLRNRALQIQRLNPEIARDTLSGSRGYYDPVFIGDARRESSSDSGGFDPADYSRDAIYDAESETVRLGLAGVLPTGMSYAFSGSYANSYGYRNFLDFDSYNLYAGVAIQQPLLKNFWIDQGRMTIRVNKKNLEITELGVAYLTMDVINQVQQAYCELLAARDHLAVQERLVAMRSNFQAGLERQVEVGMLTPPDTHLARSQHATAQAEAATARNLVTLSENALRTLLGDAWTDSADVPLAPRERLTAVTALFDLSASWDHGLRQRPDLAQLRTDLERADIDLKYRRNQLFPSLDLVAGYGRRGASTIESSNLGARIAASSSDAFGQISGGDNPSDMIGVIFTMPLMRQTERANYRVGKHLKAQAELLVKQKEELVMREISDALNSARSGLERLRAAGRAVEFARTALTAEERKLAGGKSTLFFVLQLQRDLATAESTEIRAKADYNKAVSQLQFADATLLETHQIAIEFVEP
ncbi:MAG: TolC family protein [Verrucomicrobia bacterium]|jgi:outer membrane protein TolC|nr:TolC family protein [Verrucomicrobiota bacterium]OQC63978.1 MAG: Outer membrane protein TolC precursor [Verrucomicrobia bacterium ADurb.Bin006]MDI9380577.1 TolC family protein [Verrucomicrobiota bacterium]NMD22269.1 TolC family protein [Verrucomicrobiota bacterium]HOA60167.1 TolC family protein [Verrucomicrobiota bacterium]